MTAVLEARGLAIGYGKTAVVRDLDLEVRAGEVVALLGPNGAGKTTTIRALSGTLSSFAGQVLVHGEPTLAPLHHRARDGLGLVTEQRSVLMTMTVEQNLRVLRADKELVLQLFPELEEHLGRSVGLLSGGQQQMLALGQALGRRPRVLLADELSLGLAPLIVDRLLRAVRDAADAGVGVLMVEQHVHKAMLFADRVYVMRRGMIQLSGDVGAIRGRIDEIQAEYLSASDIPA